MNLSWNSAEIKRLRNYYCLLRKEKGTNEEKYLRELCYNVYDELFSACKSNGNNTALFCNKVKYSDRVDCLLKDNLNFLNILLDDLPKNIKGSLLSLFDLVDDDFINQVYDGELKFNQRDIPNSSLVKQSYTFFQKINPNFKNNLNFIYKNNLMQISSISNYEKTHIGNCSYADFILNLGYGIVINEKNSSVVSTFNHELSHMIDMILNGKQLRQSPLYFLSETRAIFSSFLTDYNKLNNNENFKSFYNYFQFVRSYILKMCFMYKFSQKINLSDKSLNYLLLNNGLSSKQDKNFFKFPCDESYSLIMYIYSAIVALHMLNTYKNDPEKAFYYYNKSLNYKRESALECLKRIDYDYRDYDYSNSLIKEYNDFLEKEAKIRKLK